ncbi:integrase domain-containing protein [Pseudomonas sp. OIL-1]|uniref:integrase domain-containing protein n=1 Tax=Pseudomonas TaxID=286 RepID=UPI00211472E2|nr:integrase domain-containing protein [Pseudomonas sp. OIL-1]
MRSKGQSEAAAVTLLAKSLGLRLNEGSLLDAVKALKQAHVEGVIGATDGTKGGRFGTVPVIRADQFAALQAAAAIQGQGRAVIPSDLDWKEFKKGSSRQRG